MRVAIYIFRASLSLRSLVNRAHQNIKLNDVMYPQLYVGVRSVSGASSKRNRL